MKFGVLVIAVALITCVVACEKNDNQKNLRPGNASGIETATAIGMEQRPFKVVVWNVECKDSNANNIGTQFRDLGTFDIHVFFDTDLETIKTASLKGWESHPFAISGTSGSSRDDRRIHVNFNFPRFEKLNQIELDELVPKTQSTFPPLVVFFRDRVYSRKIAVVALTTIGCSSEQAAQLCHSVGEWVSRQTVPIVIAASLDSATAELDEQNLPTSWFRGEQWELLSCEPILATQWRDDNKDEKNDLQGKVLDVLAVSGFANPQRFTARIRSWADDFPDTEESSRFRPVSGEFDYDN